MKPTKDPNHPDYVPSVFVFLNNENTKNVVGWKMSFRQVHILQKIQKELLLQKLVTKSFLKMNLMCKFTLQNLTLKAHLYQTHRPNYQT